jgi:hypothetical protein
MNLFSIKMRLIPLIIFEKLVVINHFDNPYCSNLNSYGHCMIFSKILYYLSMSNKEIFHSEIGSREAIYGKYSF